jgi:hypothetical protein
MRQIRISIRKILVSKKGTFSVNVYESFLTGVLIFIFHVLPSFLTFKIGFTLAAKSEFKKKLI